MNIFDVEIFHVKIVCKRFFECIDSKEDIIIFLFTIDEEITEGSNISDIKCDKLELDEHKEDENMSLSNLHILEDEILFQEEEQNIFDDDSVDTCLPSTYDTDITLDEEIDIGIDSINNNINIPTPNKVESAHDVEAKTQCGSTFSDIKLLDHIFLNQCGILLTRKKYQINGSSTHNFSSANKYKISNIFYTFNVSKRYFISINSLDDGIL